MKLFKSGELLLLEVFEMPELTVEVSEEVLEEAKHLSQEELNLLVAQALREEIPERLMFRVADELLEDSEITDELALKWGRELKGRAARKRSEGA